jgi:endonuclease YncB( thermonuclease family)
LYGIDAPEEGQTCQAATGIAYDCGADASRAITGLVARGKAVCEPKDRDRFGRVVAVCRIVELDIGAELVRLGWAVAFRRYSRDYLPLKNDSRNAKRGMWAGSFAWPWDWRAEQRAR